MSASAPRVGIVTGERALELSEDGTRVAAALEARGYDVEPVLWTDRTVDWSVYDAAVIRSCWEYPTDHPDSGRCSRS